MRNVETRWETIFPHGFAASVVIAALLVGLLGCGEAKPKYCVVIKNNSGHKLTNLAITLGSAFGHRFEEMEQGESSEEFPVYAEAPESGNAMYREDNGRMCVIPIKITGISPKKFDGILEISVEPDKVTVTPLPKKNK